MVFTVTSLWFNELLHQRSAMNVPFTAAAIKYALLLKHRYV